MNFPHRHGVWFLLLLWLCAAAAIFRLSLDGEYARLFRLLADVSF
jgi:hypothetical protein